ncbi:MAG TPA: ribosome silencing factor [Candidatus Cloacimonadota bacterium]|nr:ribosome silencing factor [Candidatus Cloacimonadota bacterium]HPS38192.1 ribosome silencing factor [Candidatus Cloacimonadota bacterium]
MSENTKLEAVLGWLTEKKAENIKVYDVHKTSGYTDVIVVCEGSADMHNRAIASHLIDEAKAAKFQVISKEGIDYGQWILIDVGDLVVHIFLPHVREHYKIDDLFEKVRLHHSEEQA